MTITAPRDLDWQHQSSSDELLVLSCSTGQNFMQFFTETLADCFEADLVTIGELMVMEKERINVLASCLDGKPIGEFEYDTCVAPCLDVISEAKQKTFLSNIQQSYPLDTYFIKEGIQSYIGFPLKNHEGETIGLLQAAWRRDIDQEEADNVIETVHLFIERLSAELVTLHAMRILSALVAGPGQTGNLDALRLLCEQMQTALKIRVAFIAECIADNANCFRVLAYCQDGKLIDHVEGKVIPYQGTPCSHLKEKDVFLVRSQLQEAFPEQVQNKKHNLVSYLGLNIRDAQNKIIGHFALQHDREMLHRTLDSNLFKLFSARVNLELRKHQEETERKASA
ncbi:hypothetical protein [Pseudophaeobacter sp.]|uniref:hypothetical protein n=1 Tax=Pseudophaeobacter sp. TaxID=1971739 RepID=UPI0032983B0D